MHHSQITHFPDGQQLAHAAAAQWLETLAGEDDSPCAVAFSGGRIAADFFRAVVEQAGQRRAALARIHFFFADERCLPPTHAESNFALANKHLFQPLGIASQNLHRLQGEMEPVQAAREAEMELRSVVKESRSGQPVLDFVFLGMGEDGHIASLFPQEPETMVNDAAVYRAVFDSPKPPPERLTLGYQAIAAARQVWVLASGKGKEAALRESLSPQGRTPLARLLRLRPNTRVFTDINPG